MTRRNAPVFAVVLAAVAVALMVAFGGKKDSEAVAAEEAVPGAPHVEIISPRNGARQNAHAVVVKVNIENFRLAPGQFEHDPQLGEGHLRFSLNRVPNCVKPESLRKAIESPVGKGRLVGASLDFPKNSGPNGKLAEEIGSAGSYSPATRPEIYYRQLAPGFYRLIVSLAQNNGMPLPAHAVTNFQILQRASDTAEVKPCPPGKVTSAAAAAQLK